jgi:hypothetical protein
MKHFAIETDNGIFTETVACCGNDFRRTKKLTDDWREVDCPICVKLCGFTSVESDPLRHLEEQERRAA